MPSYTPASARALLARVGYLTRELGDRKLAYDQLAAERGWKREYARIHVHDAKKVLELEKTREKPREHHGLETFGLDVPNERLDQLRLTAETLQALKKEALALDFEALTLPTSALVEVNNAIAGLVRALDRVTPYGLCVFCKGIENYQAECAECDGTGIGMAPVGADPLLFPSEPLMVRFRGKIVEAKLD